MDGMDESGDGKSMHVLLVTARLNNSHLATSPSSNTNKKNSSVISYYLLDSLLPSTFPALLTRTHSSPRPPS